MLFSMGRYGPVPLCEAIDAGIKAPLSTSKACTIGYPMRRSICSTTGGIHVELLAPVQGAPKDHLLHVGVPGFVRPGLGFNATPGWRGDDLARLRLNVAKANFFVLAVNPKVRMVQAGLFAQRLPGLDGNVPIGFGRQMQHHFAGVNVSLNFGMPQVTPSTVTKSLSSPSCVTSIWVFQLMPLPPLPTLFIEGPRAVKCSYTLGAVLPGIRSISPAFSPARQRVAPIRKGRRASGAKAPFRVRHLNAQRRLH